VFIIIIIIIIIIDIQQLWKYCR